MGGFEFLELGGDIAFEAWGETLEELFRQAARAMYSSMVEIDRVSPRVRREVKLEAPQLDILLHDWLAELLFITDTEGLVFSEFEVSVSEGDEGFRLEGSALGEEVDPERHEAKTEVKAVTYHELDVSQADGRWVARVMLDV
ncbi:MAG TPA: archease [Candidatus Korarchaeota archaeon]|nr:archease [Candidatus Korarchaeota archaeon]